MPIWLISSRPSLVEYVMSPSTPMCLANAAANCELGIPGFRTSNFTTGELSGSSTDTSVLSGLSQACS